MSEVKLDSEVIAEIRNALCIIQLNAEAVTPRAMHVEEILKQVKRINGLLPKVAFEGE